MALKHFRLLQIRLYVAIGVVVAGISDEVSRRAQPIERRRPHLAKGRIEIPPAERAFLAVDQGVAQRLLLRELDQTIKVRAREVVGSLCNRGQVTAIRRRTLQLDL